MQTNNNNKKERQINCFKYIFQSQSCPSLLARLETRIKQSAFPVYFENSTSILYCYKEDENLLSLEQVSAHPQYDVHVNNTKTECTLLK